MECCPSFQLVSGKDRPRLVNKRRQQRVLYFYFLDPELGLIYIRLTTWFPFTVQVYVNGHSWLAQQMLKQSLGFNLQDNAFTALDDPHAAQRLADSFADQNWTEILNRLVRQVHPLMNEPWFRSLNYGSSGNRVGGFAVLSEVGVQGTGLRSAYVVCFLSFTRFL